MTTHFKTFVTAALTASSVGLMAGDPVHYPESTDYSKSVLGGKEGVESLKVNRLRVNLFASGSYIYDSNTSQTPVAEEASIFVFAIGGDATMGSEFSRGLFYGLNYNAQVFGYDDVTSAFGRDSLEQSLGAFVGVNGGLTKIRLNGNYRRSNGNSFEFDNFNNETRRSTSHDYDSSLVVIRDLPHGSLEFGAGYSSRDFDDDVTLNDGESTYGDLAWFYKPGFAPRTEIGFGLRFGSDDYNSNAGQDFLTPSFRWRYDLSAKTSLYSSFGYENRTVDGPNGVDSENFVYNGGVNWTPTSKTRLDLSYYQNITPSYVSLGEDVERTGFTLKMNNQLPGRFVLGTQAGFEKSGYFLSETTGAGSGRDDDFTRLGVDLSHPLSITDRLNGSWAIFYNYNTNDSNDAGSAFDQSITGFRVGLSY